MSIKKLMRLAPRHTKNHSTNLSDDLRGFGIVNCPQVLLHGCIVVLLLVEIVAILAIYHILLRDVCAEFLGQIYGKNIEISLKQQLKLLLKCLLSIFEELLQVRKSLKLREPLPCRPTSQ